MIFLLITSAYINYYKSSLLCVAPCINSKEVLGGFLEYLSKNTQLAMCLKAGLAKKKKKHLLATFFMFTLNDITYSPKIGTALFNTIFSSNDSSYSHSFNERGKSFYTLCFAA